MKDWIPLIQALIPLMQTLMWGAIIAVVLYRFRQPLFTLLSAIARRVDQGASIELGSSGIKLAALSASATDAATITSASEQLSVARKSVAPNVIYLTHRAVRDGTLDTGLFRYYRLRIFLDADTPNLLDLVSKVVYHLHPTFKKPDRISTDSKTAFEIQTIAYGEFNMTAEVHFKDGQEPLLLERYIDFHGSAA
ncbi:hypothetical protein BH10ACI1_BH10ACI1_16080 [soil metagenome]